MKQASGAKRRSFEWASTRASSSTSSATPASSSGSAISTPCLLAVLIAGAREAHSVCPYCAVGCALVAYTREKTDGTVELLQIEGNPDSPVNERRLCPKGATAMQLATSARRVADPLYRASGSDHW